MNEYREKIKKKIYVYIAWFVCGITLLILSMFRVVMADFFLPFGTAWAALAAVRIVQCVRLFKNDKALEEYFVFENDERNIMIKHKAVTYATYIYIFLSCAVIILLEWLGCYDYAAAIAYMICGFLVIYAICMLILKAKK